MKQNFGKIIGKETIKRGLITKQLETGKGHSLTFLSLVDDFSLLFFTMYNENITSPVTAISAWRNQQNSISVLCGIENDSPNALFNSKGGEWIKTAIQTFDEENFESVFGLDPSLVGSIDDKLELGVNLSELTNRNWTILVLETADVATAIGYGILGKNGEIYPSSYKKDKDGNRMLTKSGEPIFRKSFLKAFKTGLKDVYFKETEDLVAMVEENKAKKKVTEEAPF